ncbi:CHAT domain-containing protein [Scytonema sp. NUACC26]|uniref:CHAT domain-containing protein n=1 Tax=Scytonema sp. NUACC26 TaxID=3140176 RepID=UPI0038B3CC06
MKKILILSANPKDTSPLRLGEEAREIESALQRAKNRDKFEIVSKWAVRVEDLRRALLDRKPNIVHFCGHGAGTEGLALEDNSGVTQLVSSESIANLFELFCTTVECVLLNACYSEAQAQAIR